MTKIYLAALPNHEAYNYEFTCPHCNAEILLATGAGRYGNLGRFDCQICGAEYYATIDDHARPKLYVNPNGQQPASYLDGNTHPMITLDKRDGKD